MRVHSDRGGAGNFAEMRAAARDYVDRRRLNPKPVTRRGRSRVILVEFAEIYARALLKFCVFVTETLTRRRP